VIVFARCIPNRIGIEERPAEADLKKTGLLFTALSLLEEGAE